MTQANMGTYSIGVIADFSLFNQAVMNATQTLAQQTQLMTSMLSAMNLNASKSMSQMAASMGIGVKEAASGVTTSFQSMNTNIANNANQASRTITASTQQTTASLNGLQSSMNNVNTQGMANATGNLTQQHGNLQNALRSSTQHVGLLSGAFSKLRSHLEFMASGIMIAGIIGIPALMIKTASETETLTQKLRQNLELADQYHHNTQLLESDLKKLNELAGTFAVGFGANLPEVMESMQILSRRFKDVESISYLTSAALTMNKLDFVDLKKASSDLEAVMLQFGLTAQGTRQFVNDFSIAVHVARINGSELLDALQRSGSSFKQFNMGSREAIAAVAALSTETARTGSVIGNTFKSVAANFSMDKAISALDAYGIKLYDVNEQGLKTMRQGASVFGELQNLFAKLDDEGKSKLALAISGGKYQVNQMMAFLSDANNNFSQILGEMKEKSSDEMTKELLKMGMETFAVKMQQLKASFQVFSQTLGNVVLPYLKQFAVSLTGSVIWLKQHTDGLVTAFKALGQLAAAYIAIKAVTLAYATATALVSLYTGLQAIATAGLTGSMALATAGTWAHNAANVAATTSTFLSIAATEGLTAAFVGLDIAISPVLLLTAAILALGATAYVLYNYWNPILQWMKDAWNSTVNFIADNINMIMILFPPLGAAVLLVSVAWEPVVNFLKELWNGFVSFMQAIGKVFVQIFEGMCTAFPLFVSAAKTGISNFGAIIGDLIRSILPAWGNDVINFFVNLGNKLASITAKIGDTIRKNLTITGLNSSGGFGDKPYGPENKEKTAFELAQEQAEAAFKAMNLNPEYSGGGAGAAPEIGNQLGSGKKGKKGAKEETVYSIAKREYEEEIADQELMAADKIAIYQKYLTEVQKTAKEETNYKVGLGKLELQAKKDDIAIARALLEKEIAENKAKTTEAFDRKIALLEKEVQLTKEGTVERIKAETDVVNAKKEQAKLMLDIANERINRQRQINQAEIDLDDAKNKILLDNRGINEVQYNLLLIQNEEKRYQIKLKALQDELAANKDNQLKCEQIETQITTLEAQEVQKRLKMNEALEKAKLKNITELRDATANAMSQAVQDWVKGTQSMLGAIKSVFSTIINTVLKQFTDDWAKTLSEKLFSKSLSGGAISDKTKDVGRIQSEVTTQAGITAAVKAGSVARNALIQTETLVKTTADITTASSTATTEGITTGIVVAAEGTKAAATVASGQAAVASSSAALTSMLAMLPVLLLIAALTGMGGGGSKTTDGAPINLGRNPDSYYTTPASIQVPSFDVGSLDVPNDMLAQIHKGEVIVPAPFADKARSFINGETGNGGDTYHMPITLVANGNSDKAMQDMLKKHGDTIGKVVQNQIRNFKYKK